MYVGSGGAPEGVLAAAALRCVGGQMQGRLLFRNDDERGRARRLGVTPGYPTTLAAPPPVRERLTRASGRWPGAEELVRQLVTLPTHSLVSAAEREALARLVEGCSS